MTCQTSTASYVSDPYVSMLQSDANDFKTKTEKLISKACVDYNATAQTTPSKLHFEVAYGSQPECLRWDLTAPTQKLECLTEKSRRQHELRNTRADSLPTYKFHRRGVFIGWRMWVGGLGGCSCFNSVTLTARNPQADWK